MKNIFTFKKALAASVMLLAGTLASFAQFPYYNTWLRADVYPAGSGLVYVDNYHTPKEIKYAERSEYKITDCVTPGEGFIWTQPAEGWQYAGVVRDYNRNGEFDSEDKQLYIWATHYFDVMYDPTRYLISGSSTQSEEMARAALDKLEKPTDQVFAVFTKGAVAYVAVGQEAMGMVYSSKLYNEVGDSVTFSAYGDYQSPDTGGVEYYKFEKWTDADGNTLSTERELKVEVKGMEVYYANFVSTDQDGFQAEKDNPNTIDWKEWNGADKDPEDDIWNFLSVESLQSARQAGNQIYDLQGRRLTAPVKGLYIRNGKKVILK